LAEPILPDQFDETVVGLRPLELVVGIPSYNNVSTLGQIIKTAQAGLASYFGDRKALIVNSDGDSNDGTPEAVETVHTGSDMLLRVRYPLEPVHHPAYLFYPSIDPLSGKNRDLEPRQRETLPDAVSAPLQPVLAQISHHAKGRASITCFGKASLSTLSFRAERGISP
jgi:hypothetical protein